MGCGSSNSIEEQKQPPKEQKTSTAPKEPIKSQEPIKSHQPIKSQPPKPKKIPFSYYCFTEEEKKYIEELKENEEKNGNEKEDDYYDEEKKYKILFKKIEMDLKGDESICKQYYVLYLKDNFDNNVLKDQISLTYYEQTYYPRYLKKNGVELNSDFYSSNNDGFYLECDLTEEDYKRKIIIIEVCLDMEINLFYGLIMGFLYLKKNGSVLFRYDKNYRPGNIFADGLKKISDNEVYGFKFDSSFFSFRDIRFNNYDITEELGDIITSKFNQEEINQINFSLNNKLTIGSGLVRLFNKMVYNLTPEKVEITGYSVFLEKDNYNDVFSSEYEFDYIINELKINDENIPKVEYSESLGDDYDGKWFYSTKERIGLNIHFDGHVFVKEFKVEIPSCNSISLTETYEFGSRVDYGISYKYVIINNGVDLPMEQFKNYNYIKKDKTIIFSGCYNFNQLDYNDEEFIRENENAPENLNERIRQWEDNNEKKLYPSEFEFY